VIFFKSLKFRLLFSYALIVLLSLSLAYFFLSRRLEDNSLRELKSSLTSQARLIESHLSSMDISHDNAPKLESLAKELSTRVKARITVIDPSGNTLAESTKSLAQALEMENHADRPEVKEALSGSIGKNIRYSSTLKTRMLYLAMPVRSGNRITGVVRLAMPLDSVRHMLSGVRKTIYLNMFFALVIAFLLGFVFTAGMINPLNKIINVSRKFSTGDFNHRIYYPAKDEIGELAQTLNKMAQGLEEKIREVELKSQQLEAVFQSMIEGIIIVDKQSRVISVNPSIENIFDIRNEGSRGKPLIEVIRNNELVEIAKNVLNNGKPVSRELTLLWPVQKIFQVNAAPVIEKGVCSACLLVIHDISEIRKLENMRRDFVANVSHELKTPLTSIKGFVETLLEGALDDKENSRSFLKIVQDHANRLDNLISDLLKLSYLESKEIVLTKEDVDLSKLAAEVLVGFTSQTKNKNIKIENSLPKPLIVQADPDKIEQVLTNLIDNAIKFNHDQGKVRLFSQDLGDKLKIIVEDSGAGIPSKDIPRIFERFYRVDKARSRSLGGTGLGLSIVKHIIQLHAGSSGVESTEGLGSSFWFTLPK
jgi:two-component system phosphate regulon sensor histidine kinase PhoR